MLPEHIRKALKQNQVCCLATVNGEEPHLSLMFYTFLEEEGLLIMSSQTNSAKIKNIKANPKTAVLIQANPKSANSHGITLSGVVRLEEGERAANYLKIHQRSHALDSAFFSGNDITVFSFLPHKAVIADRQDRVSHWSSH